MSKVVEGEQHAPSTFDSFDVKDKISAYPSTVFDPFDSFE
jgi:hypothetical protein